MNSTCFQYRFPAAIPGQLNFISFKNSLQECCQKQQLPVPAYKSWKFSYGYAAKVEVAGNTFKSTGVQGDQKEAQQNAAYNALVGLGLIDSTVPFDVKTAAGTLYIINFFHFSTSNIESGPNIIFLVIIIKVPEFCLLNDFFLLISTPHATSPSPLSR